MGKERINRNERTEKGRLRSLLQLFLLLVLVGVCVIVSLQNFTGQTIGGEVVGFIILNRRFSTVRERRYRSLLRRLCSGAL